MKNLIFLILFIPFISFGQFGDKEERYKFVEVTVDPAQAIYGSDKNSRGLDGVIKIGARENKYQVAVFYERFNLIKYKSFGFQPSYVVYLLRNVHGLVGTEISLIDRSGFSFISYSINSQIQYHLKDFYLVAKADLKRRTDVSQTWGYSNYVGIGYKF